jgi:hypothetical protein
MFRSLVSSKKPFCEQRADPGVKCFRAALDVEIENLAKFLEGRESRKVTENPRR